MDGVSPKRAGSEERPESGGPALESAEATRAVDEVLAGVGLQHGRRQTRAGSWHAGERRKGVKLTPSKPAAGRKGKPGVLAVPGWERWPWLRAGFSTCEGGQSSVYGRGDLNLGWTREDDPALVAANRKRFLDAVRSSGPGASRAGRDALPLVAIRQMHSGMIRALGGAATGWPEERKPEDLMTADGKPVLRGDGLIAARPGTMLGVLTADCVPVLLADTRTRAVAAFHAGWRGTLARIVERGVGTMRLQFGSRPEDLVAAIGPAIRACCFAVGEEVKFEFESQFSYAPEILSEVYDSDPVRDKYPLLFLTARAPGHSNIGPQIHLDLIEANRRQLLEAGVPSAGIHVVAECTACTRLENGRRKYFSPRPGSPGGC